MKIQHHARKKRFRGAQSPAVFNHDERKVRRDADHCVMPSMASRSKGRVAWTGDRGTRVVFREIRKEVNRKNISRRKLRLAINLNAGLRPNGAR